MFEQGLHDKPRPVRHVVDRNAQQIVHFTGQSGALDDLGPGLHGRAEQVHRVALVALGVLLQADVEVRRQWQTDPLGCQQRDIAQHDTGLLESLDAPEHGRGRQANLLRQHVVGGTPVFLQDAKNASVDGIKHDRVVHVTYSARFM